MTARDDPARFAALDFEGFRKLAVDDSLSLYEKIGFPDGYRAGKEPAIFADILAKLPPIAREGAVVLDIGPGCSDLPRMLIAHARERGQSLHLVDSAEMLAQLPDSPGVAKTAALYPQCPDLLAALRGRVDAAIAYSVLQYVFVDTNVWKFLDETLALLAPGGHLLIGDIPNASMRKRFLDSENGKRFHREFAGTDGAPVVSHNVIEAGNIDDAVVLALMQRARAAGFHAFVLPQPEGLPMHNRREDLLVVRP